MCTRTAGLWPGTYPEWLPLSRSRSHQPSSSTHASMGAGAWFRCLGPMSSFTWSRRRLYIWPTIYFPFSCKLSIGLDRHCIALSPSLPLTPCHPLCHHRLIVSFCLLFRPAPRVAPPLQSNMTAITGLPVGWDNKSLSPIALYACVRACKIDPGYSNWNTCIDALF
jgi:hypothetical protein